MSTPFFLYDRVNDDTPLPKSCKQMGHEHTIEWTPIDAHCINCGMSIADIRRETIFSDEG